jgi:hypothetical protein
MSFQKFLILFKSLQMAQMFLLIWKPLNGAKVNFWNQAIKWRECQFFYLKSLQMARMFLLIWKPFNGANVNFSYKTPNGANGAIHIYICQCSLLLLLLLLCYSKFLGSSSLTSNIPEYLLQFETLTKSTLSTRAS